VPKPLDPSDPNFKPQATGELWAEVKQVNDEERIIDAMASVAVVDRQGDLVLPNAFEKRMDRFRKNPVILLAHDYEQLPIGRSLEEKVVENGLQIKVQFAPTEEGIKLYGLYKDGFMRGFSIGYIPLEWRNPTAEEVQKYGPELQRVLTQVELLEISAVPVPANHAALAIAAGWGLKFSSVDEVKEFFKNLKQTVTKQDDTEAALSAAIESLRDETALMALKLASSGWARTVMALTGT